MDDKPKPLSRIQRRLIVHAGDIIADRPEDITYQHSVLCQTCLPYRDAGPDVRAWTRRQGNAALLVEAGRAYRLETDDWVEIGLPFGPKARLVLTHLNQEALRTRSRVIETENSLSAFSDRLLNYDANGRQKRAIRDQLGRLAASTIRLAFDAGERAFQMNTHVVGGFDVWFPKDERDRVLWPRVVVLSKDYYESLALHAVPLDERAIGALAHSAMGLDIYVWLAQRLWRIDERAPTLMAWPCVYKQFGDGYQHVREFRRVFLRTLKAVLAVYPEARVEADHCGLMLRHSRPPVPRRKGRLT